MKYGFSVVPRAGWVAITCPTCNLVFYVIPAYAKRGIRFCSKECYGKWRSRSGIASGVRHPRWSTESRRCQQCGKQFNITAKRKSTAKYCSRKCLAARKKDTWSGPNSPYWTSIEKNCIECGKPFTCKPSHSQKRVSCSVECRAQLDSRHMSGDGNPSWKGGLSFEPYPAAFNARLKRKIRSRDGDTCHLCGKDRDRNGKVLAVHHIDYEKNNCREINLITLCDACNKKVNTGRPKWTRYFQGVMEERWQNS